MNKLRDKEYLKNIDKSELLKRGKYTYFEGQDDEYPEENIQGYISIYNNSAYLNGRELVLKYNKFFANAHPDPDANILPVHWQRETDTIYFDENGQYYENVEENPELKEKADSVISKVTKKYEDMHRHKIKNIFLLLFGNKKLLQDANTLTIEEIQARLDAIVEKEVNFMDKYSKEKTEDEIARDAKQQEGRIQEKIEKERGEYQ